MKPTSSFCIKTISYLIVLTVVWIPLSPHLRHADADDITWQGAIHGNIYAPETVQNVGIGTTVPKTKLHVNDGALLVEGDQGDTSWLQNLGPGKRLMWIPALGAFRAGTITQGGGCVTEDDTTTCNWDLANIGKDSIAIGRDTNAQGEYSTAIGIESNASGHGALAIGQTAEATGMSSIAIGNAAKANNFLSFAIGWIKNDIPLSLMIGFSESTPALFADNEGVIINGIPGENETRYALAVRGGIKAEEIIVDTNWADYVFGEDYQLPPLDHVAAYIKENKHLPEVPSETEIQKDGLKMADMMALQMKKIEELTLYAIQLKKENDALRSALDAQQQGIDQRLQALEGLLESH